MSDIDKELEDAALNEAADLYVNHVWDQDGISDVFRAGAEWEAKRWKLKYDSLYNKLLDGCEEQSALESGMKILKEKLAKAKETLKIYSRCKTEGDDGLFLSCGDVACRTLKEIE